MRGSSETNGTLYFTLNVEDLIERDHPLRAIKRMVDEALRAMNPEFRAAYSTSGESLGRS